MIKTFQEYQIQTAKTAIYPKEKIEDGINYCILGLCGESGEISNKFKKVLRDDGGKISDKKCKDLFDEVGDVLYYISELTTCLGYNLEDVATSNINKLKDRQERNKITGSGDNR